MNKKKGRYNRGPFQVKYLLKVESHGRVGKIEPLTPPAQMWFSSVTLNLSGSLGLHSSNGTIGIFNCWRMAVATPAVNSDPLSNLLVLFRPQPATY